MKWLALVTFLLSVTLAQANTVTVVSGEHDTFSRLVLRLPAEADWQLGRTDTGYALSIGLDDLRYDVSKVFDLIPRDRLSGIFSDPATGDLQLRVPCACHAMPFSLDAQTLVIDLRDGPAPTTSSFELTLAGDPMPPLQAKTALRPRQDRPVLADGPAYDWLAQPAPAAVVTLPVLPVQDFADLQRALVEQMAEGAARGVVDLALIPDRADMSTVKPVPDAAQLRLTTIAGMRVATERGSADMMQADGASCIADDRLNVAAWGQIADVPGQLARARLDLVGEFDAPDGQAVATQVRLYLYLGFGAEAAALMNVMPPADEDAPLWLAMAQVIDTETVSSPVFDGMAHCDSAAALWSLLAASPDATDLPNVAAVRRAFSALPRHLRLALGPRITDRLLLRNQPTAVQGIIDAMDRGATTPAAATLLAESDLDLHRGAVDGALANAEAALHEGGVAAPAALIALVRARSAAGAAIDPSVVVALEAMQDEHDGSAIAADLAEARQLALIGSGQFAALRSEQEGPVPAVFWDVLADRGTDDELLQFAFAVPETDVSTMAAGVIAGRLETLGFADAANTWHAFAAARKDADPSPGRTVDDAARIRRWQQDWSAIATTEGDPWQDLAVQVTGLQPSAVQPPLAEATRLVGASQTTRALIDALLQSTDQFGSASGSP